MKILNDQRGLTIIELVTSFSITMVTLVFLFNIVVILKESYVINSKKSDLVVQQSLLSNSLNQDLHDNATSMFPVTCPANYNLCYRVTLKNNTTKDLLISESKAEIKYGDVMLSDDSFSINTANTKICNYTQDNVTNNLDSVLMIKVDIDSNVVENYEFGIYVINLYDSAKFSLGNELEEC